MEEVLRTIDYDSDLQKYEDINDTTKNGSCIFYMKETTPYFLCDDLIKAHKSQESDFEAC